MRYIETEWTYLLTYPPVTISPDIPAMKHPCPENSPRTNPLDISSENSADNSLQMSAEHHVQWASHSVVFHLHVMTVIVVICSSNWNVTVCSCDVHKMCIVVSCANAVLMLNQSGTSTL